jgi:hypothetical protein
MTWSTSGENIHATHNAVLALLDDHVELHCEPQITCTLSQSSAKMEEDCLRCSLALVDDHVE